LKTCRFSLNQNGFRCFIAEIHDFPEKFPLIAIDFKILCAEICAEIHLWFSMRICPEDAASEQLS
jgi:hypothetical protein